MDVMFARRDFPKDIILNGTRKPTCCATLVTKKLIRHKIYKDIVCKMRPLENISVQNAKKTLNLSKLIQQIARQHGTNTHFQCCLCREVESTEQTGMGYVCCQCDIEFDIATNLESHMLTHGIAKCG